VGGRLSNFEARDKGFEILRERLANFFD